MFIFTAWGIPRRRVEFLEPNQFTIKPKNKFAINAPNDNSDPAHDNSEVVNGPDSNGVSFDRNNGKAVVNHAIPVPYPINSKFTLEKW